MLRRVVLLVAAVVALGQLPHLVRYGLPGGRNI